MSKISTIWTAIRQAEKLTQRVAELERENARIAPQLAALETRVAAQSPAFLCAKCSETELAEAVQILQQVQTEHTRIRARISSATVFTERLRVLEEKLGIDSLTGQTTAETE